VISTGKRAVGNRTVEGGPPGVPCFTDADAPMVTKAHYAVIGDLHEIVPAINDELRKRLG